MKELKDIKQISLYEGQPVTDAKLIKVLKRKIFIYDTSTSDELYFRKGIADFFRGIDYEPFLDTAGSWYARDGTSFKDYVFGLVWERNEGGKTGKYTHFSDRNQRVYLENGFYEWAKVAGRMIYSELKLISERKM